MKTTHYLGIDPGHTGALGLLNASGTTAKVWPMPTRKFGGAVELDKDALYDILSPLRKLPAVVAGVEWPNTFAGQFGDVVRHAEVFGRGKGTLDSFLWLLGFNYSHVSPAKWKAKLGLPGKTHDKGSVQGHTLWLREYPQHSQLVTGPRGGILDGPLDALLIAHYLRVGGESACGHMGGRRPAVFKSGMRDPVQEWWNDLTLDGK